MENKFRRIVGGVFLLIGFFSAWITEMPFEFSILFLIPKTWIEFGNILFTFWFIFSGLTKVSMIINWRKKRVNIISIILFVLTFIISLIVCPNNSEPSTGFVFYQSFFLVIWIFGWVIMDIYELVVMEKNKIIPYL